MLQRLTFRLFILIGLTINAQTTINLHGTVSNQAGKPVASAIVTLVKQGLKDTTGTDGAYSIINGTAVKLPLLMPENRTITLYRGFLDFSLPNPSPVKVEIFDVKGNLLKKEFLKNPATGFYRFTIEENAYTAKLLIIKASIDWEEMTFRYIPFHNNNFKVNSGAPVKEMKLTKITAINDTLKTTATGYTTKVMTVSNYDQQLNITLDSAGSTRPSSGCGKTTTLKGEQRLTISSGGKNREYIIRLPDDYDANTPYKLHFAIHCLGGTAKGVADASGYEYYGIWKFANASGQKGTTIFCSPEGLVSTLSGSALGWDNKSGVDVEFIRSLVQKFEGELCIDQSRIFSEGFSMGGSMSYALACAMPDTFRAICMHSGGPMSGCDQSHRGPVSMFITHGINDNACPYPSSGVGQLKDLASRDGCTALDIPSICKPTDNSGANPACASYDGCKTGLFCRACIFVGGHDYTAGGGASKTWIDDSTWNFFKQF